MRIMERLRRPDWLGELQAVLVAALGLMVLAAVALAVGFVADRSVTVELRASEVTGDVPDIADGVAVVADQDLLVEVADPSVSQQLTAVLTHLPSFLVVAALLVLLLRIVRRARRTDPFVPATVRRLRVLAVVAMAGGAGAFVVEMLAGFHLAGTVGVPQVVVRPVSVLVWLLVGFAIFAVAEVVRRGVAMRDELETVV